MKRLTALVAALALAVVPVFAQNAPKDKAIDVTGTWDSTVESPQGAMTSVATYKQQGETLTGTHVGQIGEVALKGTVKGNQVVYTIAIDMQGQQLTITYTGKIDGDAIAGTAEFGGMGEVSGPPSGRSSAGSPTGPEATPIVRTTRRSSCHRTVERVAPSPLTARAPRRPRKRLSRPVAGKRPDPGDEHGDADGDREQGDADCQDVHEPGARGDRQPCDARGAPLRAERHGPVFPVVADVAAEHAVGDQPPVEPVRAPDEAGGGQQQEDGGRQQRYEDADAPTATDSSPTMTSNARRSRDSERMLISSFYRFGLPFRPGPLVTAGGRRG